VCGSGLNVLCIYKIFRFNSFFFIMFSLRENASSRKLNIIHNQRLLIMTKISKCYRVTLIKRKVIKFVITKKKYKLY